MLLATVTPKNPKNFTPKAGFQLCMESRLWGEVFFTVGLFSFLDKGIMFALSNLVKRFGGVQRGAFLKSPPLAHPYTASVR